MNEQEKKIRTKEAELNIKGNGYRYEDPMLADFMIWAKNTYPQLRKSIFHIENEGSGSSDQDRMRGMQALAKGKLAGVPDVCSVYFGKMRFAEFKVQGRDLSPKQDEIFDLWVHKYNIPIVIIRTFNDWKYWIEEIVLKDRL